MAKCELTGKIFQSGNNVSHAKNRNKRRFNPNLQKMSFWSNVLNKKISLTMLASGSEVNLAINTSHKLAKDKIYSKVISMPCQEIFEKQSKIYKNKIINETKFKISIEAGSTENWKKYIGSNGLTFGIDEFGKSAPYKDIFKHFKLTPENIFNKIKKKMRK